MARKHGEVVLPDPQREQILLPPEHGRRKPRTRNSPEFQLKGHLLTSFAQDYKRYFIPLLRCALRVWTKNDENNRAALKEGYARHNAHIRAKVPADRLLIFDPSKDGWEPLCDFLDKAVPKEPFPVIDEDQIAAGIHRKVFVRQKTAGAIAAVSRWAIPVLLLLVFVYRMLRLD